MKSNITLLLFLVWCPFALLAQGFAGLGTEVEGFAVPERGIDLQFPRDHAAHPEYRIEWWYVTANAVSQTGEPIGLQWTLFRSALKPNENDGWTSPQLWMGHAAVTTKHDHFSTERLSRGGIGQAGAEINGTFEAWIDDWHLSGMDDYSKMSMRATSPEFAYDVELTANGPLVFHGDNGFSVKSSAGQASYYYSQPFYDLGGTLEIEDQTYQITGHAWLDREWSSQPLSETQTGWDWFSLSFDDGTKMMGFSLRQTKGENFVSGTWIEPDGTTTMLGPETLSLTPISRTSEGAPSLPTVWTVSVPSQDVNVTAKALNSNSWMATSIKYWEGPVVVEGSHNGVGYLEMTGYN